MTTYGTIPTPSPPTLSSSSANQYISRAKERLQSSLGTRRAWHQVLISPSLPANFNDALARITTNVSYFHMNYAIITVFVLFLSLLWHPGTLIALIIMISAWLFLYVLRDGPIIAFGQEVDDLVVLICLCGLTFLMLILTHATYNIAVGIGSGLLLVLVHAAFRGTDDLYIVTEAGGGGATVLRETV